MENVITKSDRKKITKDWEAIFPDFSQYKPMHLLRRNGPFLCGIHLQTYTSNMDYEPIFHIHNLMVEFPIIYLGTGTYLVNEKNAKDAVNLIKHQNELKTVTDRLRNQCPLLNKKALHLNEFISYADHFLNKDAGFDYYTLRDIVLALIWCDEKDEATRRMLLYKEMISIWPEGAKNRFGGEAGWEQQMLAFMDKGKLENMVSAEIKKHGLSDWQDYGFVYS
jgi:hypothetical protein